MLMGETVAVGRRRLFSCLGAFVEIWFFIFLFYFFFQILHMSPLKCLNVPSREPSPTILDLNFNEDEDEDDEEYKPTLDDISQVRAV